MIFEAEYKTFHEEGSKILTHRQMLQRLPIAVAQVIAGNISENFQNEIHQFTHSIYRAEINY